jgi:dolichol-phosphate mannosyltransferase
MTKRARESGPLIPAPPNSLFYSILLPAYNESDNIVKVIPAFAASLRAEGIPFELLVVNDNSKDDTADVVRSLEGSYPEIRLIHNDPPGGLGRAVRFGLQHARGDAIAIVMADLSDSPEDAIRCYRKIEEGYDCVFGSRFIKGSHVSNYPPVKLVCNRIINFVIRVMFLTNHNDMTNAFKVYRRHVIDAIQPLHACHFNITIELSLSALIRRFRIATIPISWEGRTWGSSNLRIRAMGRRYLATLLMIWCERILILDDTLQESESRSLREAERHERARSVHGEEGSG